VFKRLRFGEKLAAVSALALLGFLFANWYGIGLGTGGQVSGWNSLGWLTLTLCVLAIVAGLVLPFVLAGYESPVLPVFTAAVTVFLAGLACLAIVVQGIFQPGGGAAVVLSGYWLGLIAAFGIARGGFLSMHEEYLPGVPIKDVEVRPAPPAVPAA
jgi:hypothetical protein